MGRGKIECETKRETMDFHLGVTKEKRVKGCCLQEDS